MRKEIAVIKGDYIGPEIVTEAMKVMERTAEVFGHRFHFEEVLMGGSAIDACGSCLPEATLEKCLASDSVLLGAVGGPKWDKVDKNNRPEKGLLKLRSGMKLYANLRPAKIFPQLASASPLRPESVQAGIDLMIVRELTGGIYFGSHSTALEKGQKVATDVMSYSEVEIERIMRVGFETARKRSCNLVSVDKSNVLDCSRLWAEVAHRVAADYPDVTLRDMLVDNAAMQLVRDPSQFDVIVTENMFGDILTDEASVISGSLGMLSSASVGAEVALFEPIHGSYPQAAGKNIANPMATILSAAMLLEHLGLDAEGKAVRRAVDKALADGIVTEDLAVAGGRAYSTSEVGDYVAKNV